MEQVESADGTKIAFERSGDGPAVILIGGAFNDRSTTAGLRARLAGDFAAYSYDRRGRGDSGDTAPYAVDREVEDIDALIAHAGGSAALFGHSSGAILALTAAAQGSAVTKLAVYEPPYRVGDLRQEPGPDLAGRLRGLIAADKRSDAVTLFLVEAIGVPAQVVEMMSADPSWQGMTAIAHTLPYDVDVCGDARVPTATMAALTMPTLVLDGGESDKWMRTAVQAVADAVPGAEYVTIEGQDHAVLHHPEVLAPVLARFLA